MTWKIVALFFAIAIVTYGASLGNDFVRWDDGLLITENPAMREFSPGSITWAFTHFDPELYIPLTFVSYQLEMFIGGGNPFLFHLTNLLLHTANALLVSWLAFLLLKRRDAALFCGLLFLLHPLHTEAVAWASARKDVLSGFFFLGALVSYVIYLQQSTKNVMLSGASRSERSRSTSQQKENLMPGDVLRLRSPLARLGAHFAQHDVLKRPYILSLFLYLLALLSKVSAIPLPLILILNDWYQGRNVKEKKIWIEKIPFFLLSILFGIVAFAGKTGVVGGASPMETLLVATKAFAFYLQKIFWPFGFSVLYPIEGKIVIANLAFGVPFLLCTVLVVTILFSLRWTKTIAFGISFLLFLIAPSFLNLAKQPDVDWYFASDRYAYLGSIGIFLLISMIVSLREKLSNVKLQWINMVLLFFGLGILSFQQSLIWKSTETLFTHVIEQYPSAHVAYANRGAALWRRGEQDAAIDNYEHALSLSLHPKTLSNLASAKRQQGKTAEALSLYLQTIALDPNSKEAYYGLGLLYAQSGDIPQALSSYERAIDIDPTYAEAMNNIGAIRMAEGNIDVAIEQYRRAIEANSLFVEAYFNLGIALTKTGDTAGAIQTYEAAVSLAPDLLPPRINLGILLYNTGKTDGAREQFQEILKRDPGNRTAAEAMRQMGE